MSQRPLSAFPSRAAKHAGESKRGQHNQSIEPSRPTKGGCLAISNQRIIFDAKCHCCSRADAVGDTSRPSTARSNVKDTLVIGGPHFLFGVLLVRRGAKASSSATENRWTRDVRSLCQTPDARSWHFCDLAPRPPYDRYRARGLELAAGT